MLNKHIYTSVADFLKDVKFIKYVFDENKYYADYWECYVTKHPESAASFEQARYTLLHIDDCSFLTSEDKVQLKQIILKTLSL